MIFLIYIKYGVNAMLIILKKSYVVLSLVLVASMLLSAAYLGTAKEEPLLTEKVLVVDAGHGGMDGGAVGVTGVLEKNINLSVALKLKAAAEKDGWKVVMTRSSDMSLHDTESSKVRSQKRSDLQKRKEILNKNKNAIFVSIHQNKFEQAKYKGAQVFYADNEEAQKLGESIQNSLISGLDDGNTRVAKKITDEVYLLKGVKTPAVIVECGFLSNPEEEQLLTQNTYQTKVADAIFNGVCNYKGEK